MEFLVLIIVILLQVRAFSAARKRIHEYLATMPGKGYECLRYSLPQVAAQLSTGQLRLQLARASAFVTDAPDAISVPLLTVTETVSERFQQILSDLNVYLFRVRNGVAEFRLMEQVVKRPLDSAEEEVSASLPIPLYIGLGGTMLGIVVGLGSMYVLGQKAASADISNLVESTNANVQVLLRSVSAAMIASLAGLGMTTFLSWQFKDARRQVELAEDTFLTFLQVELLPVANKDIDEVMRMMRTDLREFNQDFSKNLNSLKGAFSESYDALNAQREIIRNLQSADMTKIVTFNINAASHINDSLGKLQELASYMNGLSGAMSQMHTISEHLQAWVERTKDMEQISKRINQVSNDNFEMIKFLKMSFAALDNYRHATNEAISGADVKWRKSFEDLDTMTETVMKSIKDHLVLERVTFTDMLRENRGTLTHLNELPESTKLLKQVQKASQEQLKHLDSLSQGMEVLAKMAHIELAVRQARREKWRKFWAYFGIGKR